LNHTLYVSNLSYKVNNEALENRFAPYGTVKSATIVIDRGSGRSKGFGFVAMSSESEAQAAIAGLNGKKFEGRGLVINVARPQEPRNRGGDSSRGGHCTDGGRRDGATR